MSTGTGTTTYKLDPAHSGAHFSIKHMMIASVRGAFMFTSGSLIIDNANHEASFVEAVIDVNSVHTGQTDRDNHLRSGDFFDAATYPTITFASTSIKKLGDNEAEVGGDLTIHGVTKEVTLDVEGGLQEVTDPYGNVKLGFTAETKIKRSDYGILFNAALETGGVVVGDEVKITIDAQFIKA